jgi:hypothetical protein
MIHEESEGSVTVTVDFSPFEPDPRATDERRLLRAVEYIAEAVGVLARANVKEARRTREDMRA